jgi:signal transduction histidine kinase
MGLAISTAAGLLRRTQRRLAFKLGELQALLDAVPAAVLITRDLHAQRFEMNRFATRLSLPLAKSPPASGLAEPSGHDPFEAVSGRPPVSPERLPVRIAATTGSEVRDYEFDVSTEAGEVRHLLGNATPFRDARGRLAGAVGAFVDVTDLKRSQAQLAELNRSLETRVQQAIADVRAKEQLLLAQGRHAAMGEMIDNIAHQWRQPLTALGLVLHNVGQLARRAPVPDPALAAAVEQGNRLIRKMSITIDDFRDFFRPAKNKLAFSALGQLHDTLRLIDATLHDAGIRVAVEAACDPIIDGYPNEFSQVLLNLISNARQAILTSEVKDGRLSIWLGEQDGLACIKVRDNGGGIPTELLEKIFDPYFSTREDGSGIGLSMSRQLVERSMGGRLEARNVEGGAELILLAPLAAAAAPARPDSYRTAPPPADRDIPPQPPPAPPQAANQGPQERERRHPGVGAEAPDASSSGDDSGFLATLTVLLVEDDEGIREQLELLLRPLVARLITAANGEAGLQRFREDHPALVVTDLHMPRMDGLAMSAQIRRSDADVPIVVVTAFEHLDHLRRAIDVGIDKFVTKPVDVALLEAALLDCARRLRGEALLVREGQRELERMKAHEGEMIGLLAAGMAHDYNNLLQVVLGALEPAAEAAPPESGTRALLAEAMSVAPRAAELGQKLLLLSGGWLDDLLPSPLEPALRAGVASALAGSHTELRFELPEATAQVQHDPSLLERTFACLAQNAREAMNGVGMLTVTGRRRRLMAAEVPPLAAGEYAEISLQDTGPGIAAEVLPRIFDPYFSTKPRGGVRGMGLNLALAAAIIRRHKGLITARSMPGSGAVFTVLLPCQPSSPAQVTNRPTGQPGEGAAA